jgi:protein NRD1
MFGTPGGLPSSGAMQPAPALYQAQANMPFLPTSQPPGQPVNTPGLPYAFPPAAAPAPPGAAPPPQNGNQAAATVQLVAALAAQGIPIDKIASVIQMMGQTGAIPPAAAPQMPQPTQTGYAAPPVGGAPSGPAPWDAPRPDDARDRAG